jgi:lipopolysaccharide exporter
MPANGSPYLKARINVTSDSESKGEKDLSSRVVTSTAWLIAMRWGSRLIGLVSTVIVARLLTPEDFGIVAIATSYIGIVLGVTELNLSRAIIQFNDPKKSEYDTAWTLSLIRGVLLSAMILASAIPMASFMNEPRLVALITVLAVSPLILGLENSYFVEFQKEMKFSKLFWAETSSKVLAVATTISLAVIYRNYWALVGGMLVSNVAKVSMGYWFRPAMPRLCLSAVRRFLGFAVWLSAQAFLTEFNSRFFNFIIGAKLGATAAGKFHMSVELSELISEIIGPIARATYSAYSKINDDIHRISNSYASATAVLVALVLPAGIGLSLVSHDFVFVLLGDQWVGIAPYLMLLAAMASANGFVATADSVLISLGHQKQVFLREVCLSAATLICILGAIWHGSLMGFVIARVVSGIVWIFLTHYFVQSYLEPWLGRVLWKRCWRTLASVGAMIIAVTAVGYLFPENPSNIDIVIRLGLSVMVGMVSYTATHMLLWWISGNPEGPEEWAIKNLAPIFGSSLSKQEA